MSFLISQQTEAEQDNYLIDCFYDAKFIDKLRDQRLSIVAGRKGTGKTALAKYLQLKHYDHDYDFAYRISIDEIAHQTTEDTLEVMVLFVIVKTIKALLETEGDIINSELRDYWKDFFYQNGLQEVDDYESFTKWAKTKKFGISIKAIAEIGGSDEYKKTEISNSAVSLFNSLKKSISPNKRIAIFIDDVSDYLDRIGSAQLKSQIDTVRDLLLRLDKYNSSLLDDGKDLLFIACIREDLFEFMEGSNINKLENNSLRLTWTEKSFCGLIIRRLPFYNNNISESLINPVKAILDQFPNSAFSEKIGSISTKHYATNFYTYMMAMTFNRPRDFLKFCYALRDRLSKKHPATMENIESAEIEYSDYFLKELKDELFLSSKILDFKSDIESIKKLMAILAKEDEFSFGQLKTELASYLNEKASNKKVADFLKTLWVYGILGFRLKNSSGLVNFKYMDMDMRYIPEDELTDYKFYLHKGIFWAMRKSN